MKFKDYEINLSKNPIIIVGQNPGRQRKNDSTINGLSWNGNKSADLLFECIGDLDNLLLTNICQYQDMTEEKMYNGYIDLQKKIIKLKPKLIICLGGIAFNEVDTMDVNCDVVKLLHPSYICRFQKDKASYRKNIRSIYKKYTVQA